MRNANWTLWDHRGHCSANKVSHWLQLPQLSSVITLRCRAFPFPHQLLEKEALLPNCLQSCNAVSNKQTRQISVIENVWHEGFGARLHTSFYVMNFLKFFLENFCKETSKKLNHIKSNLSSSGVKFSSSVQWNPSLMVYVMYTTHMQDAGGLHICHSLTFYLPLFLTLIWLQKLALFFFYPHAPFCCLPLSCH